MLFHPGAASIDCRDCQSFIYDLETGRRQTYRAGPTLEEKPCRRPAGSPTPCHRCPKQSPENARRRQLSQRNLFTWELFRRHRAAALPHDLFADATLAGNFADLQELVQLAHEDWTRPAPAPINPPPSA